MIPFNTQNQQVSPTLYGFTIANRDSTVDKTMLSFSMWKTTIRLGIFPLIESDDDQLRYDKKNGVSIYLTPVKAHIFAELIKKFMEDPKTYHGKGVYSGANLVTIEDPTRSEGFNKPAGNPVIVVRKINPDTGIVEISYAYEVRSDTGTIITDFNEKTREFNKDTEMYKFIELDMIITQLEEYYKAMTNNVAFTVSDALYTPLDKMAGKLGLDFAASTYTSYKTSYFTGGAGSAGAPTAEQSPYTGNGLENMMNNNSDLPF